MGRRQSASVSVSQPVLRQVLKHLTSINLISYLESANRERAGCCCLIFLPTWLWASPALPARPHRLDPSALPHLLPACQFNLTRLREKFDLIKPVAASILLRGPSVSPLRLRLDSDNYFFFPGYCIPLPFCPWREQGGRPVSWDLRIDVKIKEGSGLWPQKAPLCLTWPCLRQSTSPRGVGNRKCE